VNITGSLVEGITEQEFDGVHDMLVRCLDLGHGLHLDELFQVAQVDLGGHFLGCGRDRGTEPVELRYDLEDVAFRRHDPRNLVAHPLDVFEHFEVVGIGHGDGQTVVIAFEGDGDAAARESAGKYLGGDFGIELQRVYLPEGKAGMPGNEFRYNVFGQCLSGFPRDREVKRGCNLDGGHFLFQVHSAPMHGLAPGFEQLHSLHVLFDLDLAGLLGGDLARFEEYLREEVCRQPGHLVVLILSFAIGMRTERIVLFGSAGNKKARVSSS